MDKKALKMTLALTAHMEAMKDDDYLCGHPEWEVLCEEALELGEYMSSFLISGN